MQKKMTALSGRAILSMVFVTAGTFLAAPAHAQCSRMNPKSALAWSALPAYNPMFLARAGTPSPEKVTPQARGGDASIVGLWQVNFTAGGQIVDQAYEIFHSDGTEMMVDTAPPASDNVCVGVWTQGGGPQVKLNHVSWTFDDQGNLNGTATIKFNVTLGASGDTFTGSFTVDVFDLHGAKLDHLNGNIEAKRVTAD